MNMLNLKILSLKTLFDEFTNEEQDKFRDLIKKPEVYINNDRDLELLCRYIYGSMYIDHFVYEGKKYYESDNTWFINRNKNNELSPVLCNGYMKCELSCMICRNHCNICMEKLDHYDCKFSDCEDEDCEYDQGDCEHFTCEHIEDFQTFSSNVDVEKVEYVISREETYDILCYDDENYHDNFLEFLDKHGDDIMIKEYNKDIYGLNIQNSGGVNPDHRGSTHCKLGKDNLYEKRVEIELPCTIMKFAEALYRVKGSKWDNNYEMYINADYDSSYGYESTLILSFGHGS